MKKTMSICLVALMAAGAVSAQKEPVKATAEAALMSAYVFRGQVINRGMVLQPQLTLEQYGVSLNFWGNYDLERNNSGTKGDFSEIDLTLAYTLPIDINQATIDIGLVSYQFPANGQGAVGTPSTAELFIKGTVQAIPFVKPSLTLFGDIKEVDGAYFLADVVAPFAISDYLSVEAGASIGYGNTAYNSYYWEQSADAGVNDYNVYANASYEIMDGLTVSANLTMTWLDGIVRSDATTAQANRPAYEAKQQFWGGMNVAYDF